MFGKKADRCSSRWVVHSVTVLWLHVPWPRTDAPSCGRIYNLRRQPMGTLAQLLGNKPSHLLWQDPPSLRQILISRELVWPTLWPPVQFHILWRQRKRNLIQCSTWTEPASSFADRSCGLCVLLILGIGRVAGELSFDQWPLSPTQFPFDNSNPMEDQSKGLWNPQ